MIKNTRNASHWYAKARFTIKSRINLYNQIRAMASEGIPVVDIIGDLEKIYKSENKNDYRSVILGEWRKALSRSGSFIKEIGKWIPESEVVMFKTAEETGQWVSCLDNLMFQMEKQAEIKGVVKSMMVYPLVLILFLAVVLFGFGMFGVPILTDMAPVSQWPDMSILLHDISMFLVTKWPVVIGALVISFFVIFRVQRTFVRPSRRILDKFPPFSIYKSMEGASFLISLAALLRSGIPFTDAVSIIEENASPWVRSKIKSVHRHLNRGRTGPESLIADGKLSMFNSEVRVQVKAYSKLANIEQSISRIGKSTVEITLSNVKFMMGIVRGVLMLMVAMSIVWIYASFAMVTQEASKIF